MSEFLDDFSHDLWAETYKDYKDETVDDTFKRIATAIASVEETEELQKLWTKRFYEMLQDWKVVPGGRIISNAGTEWGGTTLINCFVAPREVGDLDSIRGITKNELNQKLTLKSEGGWGENFSYIRPRGTFIHGIGVDSPGSIKFMEGFDKHSEVVTSGSGTKSNNPRAKKKIRKGAMMAVMDVWHPDIIEFITAKQSAGRLTKFNMSVNCTDEFMEKVISVKKLSAQLNRFETDKLNQHDKLMVAELGIQFPGDPKPELINIMKVELDYQNSWTFKFPDTTHPKYDEVWDGDINSWEAKGYPVNEYRTVPVLDLWDMIMKSTYNRAEPGILWLDRANYYNPLNYFETIYATNPCGEQTLAAAGVCCLLSANLTAFIKIVDGVVTFDFAKFKKYLKWAVRFLDNVNTYSDAPLPEYKENMIKKRRIGVGVMGWGSLLMMLKTKFGSEDALELQEKIAKAYSRTVYEASIDLAEEKGMFEYCVPEKHAESPFIIGLGLSDKYMDKLREVGIRNSACLSMQPTGNTGIFANVVSGGIEPVFMPEYIRTKIVSVVPDEIADVTPKWWEGAWHETSMFKFTKEGDEEILKGTHEGTVYKIDKSRGLTKEIPCIDRGVRFAKENGFWRSNAAWGKTTTELSVDDHIKDLKGWAKYVDSAISKTVNLPHEYSYEQFEELYLEAYNTGYIKGLTTYRTGTMTAVLSAGNEKDSDDEEIILDDVKLPEDAPAKLKTFRSNDNDKKWYVTVNFWDDENRKPFALFVSTTSREPSVQTGAAVERLLRLAEEKGIKEEHITKIKDKIGGDSNVNRLTRCVSFLLRHGVLVKNIVAALEDVNVNLGSFLFHIKKYLGTFINDGEKVENENCGECGNGLVFQEGCVVCTSCGWTKCG